MRRIIVGLAAAVLLAGGGQLQASVTFYDNFNDNALDPSLWSEWTYGSGVSLAETNQRLEISFNADAGSNGDFDGFGSIVFGQQRLSGDFDLRVSYQLLDWPAANGVRVGMHVSSPDGTWYAVERVSFGGSNDFTSFPRENYLVDAARSILGMTETADQSGSLRLARNGDQISAYYFGLSDWVSIADVKATSEDMRFDLSAWSADYAFTDQAVRIAFDNFEVVPEPSALAVWSFLAIAGIGCGWWKKRRPN
jgi:hypothetical protein